MSVYKERRMFWGRRNLNIAFNEIAECNKSIKGYQASPRGREKRR